MGLVKLRIYSNFVVRWCYLIKIITKNLVQNSKKKIEKKIIFFSNWYGIIIVVTWPPHRDDYRSSYQSNLNIRVVSATIVRSTVTTIIIEKDTEEIIVVLVRPIRKTRSSTTKISSVSFLIMIVVTVWTNDCCWNDSDVEIDKMIDSHLDGVVYH